MLAGQRPRTLWKRCNTLFLAKAMCARYTAETHRSLRFTPTHECTHPCPGKSHNQGCYVRPNVQAFGYWGAIAERKLNVFALTYSELTLEIRRFKGKDPVTDEVYLRRGSVMPERKAA